jgi:hypothetical protein
VQYLFVSLPNDLDSVAFGPGSDFFGRHVFQKKLAWNNQDPGPKGVCCVVCSVVHAGSHVQRR